MISVSTGSMNGGTSLFWSRWNPSYQNVTYLDYNCIYIYLSEIYFLQFVTLCHGEAAEQHLSWSAKKQLLRVVTVGCVTAPRCAALFGRSSMFPTSRRCADGRFEPPHRRDDFSRWWIRFFKNKFVSRKINPGWGSNYAATPDVAVCTCRPLLHI